MGMSSELRFQDGLQKQSTPLICSEEAPKAVTAGVAKINGLMVRTQSYQPAARRSFLQLASRLRRGEYFGGLFVVSVCANGFAWRIAHSIEEIGLAPAFFRTFGISVIVSFSWCRQGSHLSWRDDTSEIRPLEVAIGAGFITFIIVPIGPLSWIAVTALSVFILLSTGSSTSRRGAIILLAHDRADALELNAVSAFCQFHWRRRLPSELVAGNTSDRNLVEFADKSGQLVHFPPVRLCECLACLLMLAYVELVGITQKLRDRSILVPSSV